MNFEPDDDQRAFLDAVEKLAAGHAATPAIAERLQTSDALENDLAQSGFFEAMQIDELGPVAATAMVVALARMPLCTELVASALIAPWLCPGRPRPFAVLWEHDDAPTRFLPVARTLIRVRAAQVDVACIDAGDVTPVESLFAYPMGVLKQPSAIGWERLPDADAARVRDGWRVGLAAEAAGCLGAALDAVLAHVKERRQFGRPLGAFQAVQHRLAECAALVAGVKWLALHAAGSASPLDAALAAGQAQEIARKVAYDLHQFMGAMGLTLEHPLHRWTYRTKLLASDLGGAARQFTAAAQAAWPAAASTAPEGTTQ